VPIYLFASIRRGVSPEVNAIATVLLTVTILAMVLAGLAYRRGHRRSGPGAVAAGDAAVSGVPMASAGEAG
jgi:spermidine/putrescine transport system permease protein